LDALRFCAFLLVFESHALMGGDALAMVFGRGNVLARLLGSALTLTGVVGADGMWLFFVLSSYLITQLLLIELGRTGTVRVKDFYVRRILRIWPLYFFFLGLGVVLGWIFPASYHLEAGRIAAFLLLAGNWYIILHGFGPATVGILWSISVEEQFYLLWPGLVLLGRNRARVLAATLAVTGVSLASMLWLAHHGAVNRIFRFNSFTQFLMFATGAQLALFTHTHKLSWKLPVRLGVAALGVACWFFAESTFHLIGWGELRQAGVRVAAGYCLVAVGAALIFAAAVDIHADSVPGWLRYLGKISYGLYVFHLLMLYFTIWLFGQVSHALGFHGHALTAFKVSVPVAALGFTLAAASLSYRWLETPFLRLRKRFTVVASRAV
jgi:peptidoglycan/LPS O-acetylase OafA/YrhL